MPPPTQVDHDIPKISQGDLMPIDTDRIHEILTAAHSERRSSLYEHECYDLLEATGAEAAPVNRLIQIGERPTPADLENLNGDKVVLKVVSPDITHKTEARGVRIVARELGAVEAAFDLMLREVPETYGAYLEGHAGEIPAALTGRRGHGLEQRLADRIVGILLCSFMPSDAQGFATELFVGIRDTDEEGRGGCDRAHRYRRWSTVLRALPLYPEL